MTSFIFLLTIEILSLSRVSAYAQLSADITKQIELLLFTEKEIELKQFKMLQERMEKENKQKDNNLAGQIAIKIQENEVLKEANIALSDDLNSLEKAKERLQVRSMVRNISNPSLV